MSWVPSEVLTVSRLHSTRITWNSSEMPLPPWMSRANRAISSALPQLLRLSSDTAGGAALLQEPPEPERRVQAERDLGLHVGELLLDELVGGERTAELLAVERVLARPMPAKLRRAHRAPGNAGARHVEAAEGAAQPFGVRQHVLLRHEGILEHDLAGNRCAQ